MLPLTVVVGSTAWRYSTFGGRVIKTTRATRHALRLWTEAVKVLCQEATDGRNYAFGTTQPGSRVRFERLEQLRRAPRGIEPPGRDRSNDRASTVLTPQDEHLRPVSRRRVQACTGRAAMHGAAYSLAANMASARATKHNVKPSSARGLKKPASRRFRKDLRSKRRQTLDGAVYLFFIF